MVTKEQANEDVKISLYEVSFRKMYYLTNFIFALSQQTNKQNLKSSPKLYIYSKSMSEAHCLQYKVPINSYKIPTLLGSEITKSNRLKQLYQYVKCPEKMKVQAQWEVWKTGQLVGWLYTET